MQNIIKYATAKNIILLIAIAAAVWALLVLGPRNQSQAQVPNAGIEKIAPGTGRQMGFVGFIDQSGQKRKLEEFQGNVLLVNFWAIWCEPCKREMPALDRIQAEYGPRGLQVIPLSNDNANFNSNQEFYQQQNIRNLPIYLDRNNVAFRQFRLRALPTTVILDRQGKEISRIEGYIDWTDPEVRQYLSQLL